MGDFVVQLLVNGRLCHPISCYRAMRHRNTMGCCFTNWVLGGGHVDGELPSKPLKALDKDITPFEAWYNRKPNLGHIRILGCKAYAHVPVQIRSKTLWDSHSTKCVLIGYSDTENIYELSVITRGVAIRKRDVIFCANQLGSTVLMSDAVPRGQLIFPIEHLTVHHFPAVYANYTLNSQPRPTPAATSTPVLDTFRKPIQQSIAQLPTPTPINDSGLCFMDPVVQSIQNPQPYDEIQFVEETALLCYESDNINWNHMMLMALQHTAFIGSLHEWKRSPSALPRTYNEAIASPDSHFWLLAMNTQLKKLLDTEMWDLVFFPPGKRAIDNKWVFSKKEGAKKANEAQFLHTARLVAHEDLQSKGVDYEGTFTPVVKLVYLCILLTHAAHTNLETRHWDIIAAFLNGDIDQEVYMKQPNGFDDGSSRVCRLRKAIYGLCQSARAFFQRLDAVLKARSWISLNTEWAMWIYVQAATRLG